MASDARNKMKVYLDTHIVDANLTDDSAVALVNAVMYAYPPYALDLEFIADGRTGRAPSDIIDIGFFIDKPTSKAIYDHDSTIAYYNESIPIHVHCVDRPDVTSELLLWKAENELRTRFAANPYASGSMWELSETKDNTIRYGATTIFGFTIICTYLRDTT